MALEQRSGLTGGRLHSAIANSVVRVHRECTGRGPTRAQAFSRDNVVVLLMGDTMTRGQRALVTAGNEDAALLVGAQLQRSMRNRLVRTVEALTGCQVVAFLSDGQVVPDMIAELFVLDRPLPVTRGAPGHA